MTPGQPTDTPLEARYFDGHSSRPHRAQLWVREGQLHIAPQARSLADANGADAPAEDHFTPLQLPLSQVRWPERTRHGGRQAQLPEGASLQALDSAVWDEWVAREAGSRPGLVVRAQQSWRGVLLALVLLMGGLALAYVWGLPVLARGVTALVPTQIDAAIGRQGLASLDAQLFAPSKLPAPEQARIREDFARQLRQAYPEEAPPWRLEFRRDRTDMLGPNALALPGGTMVLTDELVDLMHGDHEAVVGVLGHEYGHVRRRHTMRMLVQAGLVGFAASVAFGDYGTLISSAPVLLATLGYSRAAEREADEDAVRLLRANGRSPLAMVRFFEAMQRRDKNDKNDKGDKNDGHDEHDDGHAADSPLGIAFASHPATAERIAYFRAAAAQ